jgi:heat shock protein HslJ
MNTNRTASNASATRRTLLRLAGAVVLAFGLGSAAGCASMGSAGLGGVAEKLVGNWAMSQLGGTDIAKLLPGGMKVPSLSFAKDGGVTGFTGINNLSSKLDLASLAKGEFNLTPATMTKMAGSGPAANVENLFTDALSKVKSFNLSGDNLSLGNGVETLMKFAKSK